MTTTAPHTATAWRVSLLGRATLSSDTLPEWRLERKLAACLAYLALEGPTYRARLAGLLWPDSPEGTARNNLSQMLRKVRLTTGADLLGTGDLLALGGDVTVDAARARDLYARGRYAELLQEEPQLLPGLSYDDCPDLDDWLLAERERFSEWTLHAARAETARFERAGEYDRALDLARRVLDLDPASEDAHRTLMRLHYLRGDRPAALRAYHKCQEVLRREFDVDPLPETVQLARDIDAGRVELAAPPGNEQVRLPLAVLRPPRLVGREAEWARMEEAWRRGQWILISGESGSGKTRLALDFAASKGDYQLYPGRPGDRSQPWATSVRNFRATLRQRPDLPMEPWVRREISRLLPELAVGGEEIAPITSESDLLRFHEAALAFNLAAHEGMASTVSDDWQYYDDQTNQNGLYLFGTPLKLGEPGTLPPLILTYRSGELPPESASIAQEYVARGVAVHIELGALPSDALDALMNDIGVPPDPLTRQRLVRHTGGHPVFLLETVKHLIETGQLHTGLPEKLPLPEKVRQTVLGRLARLSEPARQAARAASVLQRDFTVNLVADVLGAPLMEIARAWGELEDAQVVRGDGFWHDLVYEAVAADVPAAVRTLLHRGAARALERADADPARIAHHWIEGGNPGAALPHLRKAERAAHAEYRPEDAARLREQIARLREEAGDHAAPERAADGLPLPPSSFHGREDERAQVRALLDGNARLVTLVGPGGVGKTRLALEVAREVAPRFSDGAVFVPLADVTDARQFPKAVARALGVAGEGSQDPLEAVRAALRPRSVLLVLDNFEHLLDASTIVAQLLSGAPEVRVLATSRAPLRLSGERVRSVAPLPLPDPTQPPADAEQHPALALLVQRAQEAGATLRLTTENVGDLCAVVRQLDGLPLALELAAARLRAMPPAALRARLERALPVLVHGPRDLPVRQQTLRAAIAWSADLLPCAERALLRRLAVFSGGWTLDAAERVADPNGEGDVLEQLGTLIEHSLVRWTDDVSAEARYTMLATVREYALEELEASGEREDVQDRHAHVMLDTLRRAEAGLRTAEQWRALRDAEAEAANVTAAFSFLLKSGQLERAATLAEVLAGFWWINRSLLLSKPTMVALREHPGWAALGGLGQARATFALAALLFWHADHADALRFMREAHALYTAQGDARGEIASLAYVQMLLTVTGRLDEAQALGDRNVANAERCGDPYLQAQSLQARGIVALRRADAAELRRWGGRLHDVAHPAGDLLGQMHAHWFMSVADRSEEHWEAAADHIRAAQKHANALQYRAGQLMVLMAWAQLALQQGELPRAALILGVAETAYEHQIIPQWSETAATIAQLREAAQSRADLEAWRARGRALSLPDALDQLARTPTPAT